MQVLSRLQDLLFGALACSDVNEGNDNAGDLVLRRAIRQDAAQVPPTAGAAYFGLHRNQPVQDLFRILQQIVVGEFLRQVRERPANVRLDEIQEVEHRWRESAHAKTGVEEQHGDVGAAEKVG